jgi:hypothetical protein
MYKDSGESSVIEHEGVKESYDPDRALEVFEAKYAEAYFSEIDPLVLGVIDRVEKGNYLSQGEKRAAVTQVLEVIERFSMNIRQGEQVHKGIPVLSSNGKESSVSISRFDVVKERFKEFLEDPEGFLGDRQSVDFRTNIMSGRLKFLKALAESNPY